MANVPKLNCAGQSCPERDGCRRYEVRVPDRHEKSPAGIMLSFFEWGSFDIERQHFGTCQARAVIVRDRRGEAHGSHH